MKNENCIFLDKIMLENKDDTIDLQGIPHKKLAPIIKALKKRVLKSDVVKDIFDKYDISEDEIDLIPMCFAKIPVSARTDHGVIYININLLKDGDIAENDHYLAHEITHYAQQTTGSKPTKGSTPENYLDNPVEQEGFQNQSKYIADTQGEDEAKEYIDGVLEHHNVSDNNMATRRKKLLNLGRELGVELKTIGG